MAAGNSSSEHWHYSQLQDNNFELHGKSIFYLLLLFSIILLIIFLFFYARWFCRYLPNPRATANESHAPQVADTKMHLSLPVVLYGVLKKEKSVVECCICIGVFEEQDKVKVLPVCGHCFHSECVDKWLSTQSSCPICRAGLRVDSLV
ncbi:RING-H2 finger protein ATL66-like [Apium graveolens]|uniref:RING-H2 finger protein ATL66-like n=1 Tax=Apium graveolens TaxID=4045 RepID=UPI003D7AED0F